MIWQLIHQKVVYNIFTLCLIAIIFEILAVPKMFAGQDKSMLSQQGVNSFNKSKSSEIKQHLHAMKKMKMEDTKNDPIEILSKMIIDTNPDTYYSDTPSNEMKTCSPSSITALHHKAKACQRGSYRCGRCGQLKINHVCGGMDGHKLVCSAGVQTNMAHDVQRFVTYCTTQTKPIANASQVFAALETVYGKGK